MTKTDRILLHRAADIIEQYAGDFRDSNVVNGTWKGKGARALQEEWKEMLRVARALRSAADGE